MINISVRSLHAFLVLEECRQFTLAAKRCNMTQSALSQMIGRLEEQVGMRLFDRDTRSVRLSAEGELFSIKAQEILEHIERAMKDMKDYSEKKQGRLSLAIVPSLAGSWIPSLLDKYHKIYPGVSLEMFDTYSERCLQLLRENRAELAVTAQPGEPGEFLTSTLFEEKFYLVGSVSRVPKRAGTVSLGDIHGLPIIQLTHTESIRVVSASQVHRLGPMLRSAGAVDVGLEAEHAATLAGLIKQGLGCSVVPHSMIEQFKDSETVILPFARNAFRRRIFLVQRQWSSSTPAASAFIEMMKDNLPNGVTKS